MGVPFARFIGQITDGGTVSTSPITSGASNTNSNGKSRFAFVALTTSTNIGTLTDNKGNPDYVLVAQASDYSSTFDLGLYITSGRNGGAGHSITLTKTPGNDPSEIEGFFVEIVNGGTFVGTPVTLVRKAAGNITSPDFTLSVGNALALLAMSGGGFASNYSMVPYGYDVLGQQVSPTGTNAQGIVAARYVLMPGTFNATVNSTPTQGDATNGNAIILGAFSGLGPWFSTQPVNQVVSLGASATLTAAASGNGTVTYQWKRQDATGAFVNVTGGSGATTASYTTPALTLADHGTVYRCDATDVDDVTSSVPVEVLLSAQTNARGRNLLNGWAFRGKGRNTEALSFLRKPLPFGDGPLSLAYMDWFGLAAPAVATVNFSANIVESADIVGAVSAVGASPASAAANIVEQPDQIAAAASIGVTAAASLAENADDVTAAASIGVTISTSVIEAPDAASATASVAVSAAAAVQENGDAVGATASVGSVPVSVTTNIAEQPDQIAAAASIGVTAAASLAENADDVTAAASIGVTISTSVIEAPDAVSATASVGVSAAAAVQENGDAVGATTSIGSVPASAAANIAEQSDQIAAAASVGVTAATAVAENADGINVVASVGVTTNASVIEAPDAVSANTSVGSVPVSVVGSIAESAEAVAAQSAVAAAPVSIAFSLGEKPDILSGAASAGVTFAGAVAEIGDYVSAVASVGVSATASVTEFADQISALLFRNVGALVAIYETPEVLSATLFAGALPVYAPRPHIVDRPITRYGDRNTTRYGDRNTTRRRG